MIDALFVVALLCGFFAAHRGNATAWALIASTGFTSALILAGVPFDPLTWLLIDVAVIVAVEAEGPLSEQDRAARSLFPVAWVFYLLQPHNWTNALTLLVAAQFFLITPWDRLGELRFWKARTA